MHPGGQEILIEYAGKDVSKEFHYLHKSQNSEIFKNNLCIGQLDQESI